MMRLYFMQRSPHQRLSALLFLLCCSIPALCLSAEEKPQLLEIPHPNLAGLEQVVIDQLKKGRTDVEMIADNPESDNKLKALTFGNLGHLYHAYDFLDAAAACYYNATLLQGDVYRWNYCVAFVAQKQGDFEKALDYFKRARAADVSTDLIYLVNIRIGECYQSLSDVENAGFAFSIAYTLNPKGPAVLARMGELALAKKDFQNAVHYLGLALTLEPSANKLHYPLAMAYRRLGNTELAQRHLSMRGIVGIQPPDPLKIMLDSLLKGFRIHILQGKSAFAAERYEEAAQSFQKAIAEDPNMASGWVDLGVANWQLQKTDEALANFAEALRLDPGNMTAHYNIGDLLLHLGQSKKAIEHLRIFLENNPEDAVATAKLATAYRNDNMAKEAIDYYQKSLNLDHSQVDTWLKLIDVFERLSAFKIAAGVTELGLKKLPAEKQLLAKLAHLLATAPEREARDGRKALQIALNLYAVEENYLTARLVALAYAELDQCDKAEEWLEKATTMATTSFQNDAVLDLLKRNKEYISTTKPCRVPYLAKQKTEEIQ